MQDDFLVFMVSMLRQASAVGRARQKPFSSE
jgi:hypothetical protein